MDYISEMRHACLTKGRELGVHVSVWGSLRLAPITIVRMLEWGTLH